MNKGIRYSRSFLLFIINQAFRKAVCHLPIAKFSFAIGYCLFAIGYCLLPNASHAQTDTVHKQRIAIFAPLYLDSAFDAGYLYRYGKAFPKFINPGLEFFEGAQLALDSLQTEHAPLEIFVFDTRAANSSIEQELKDPLLDSVDLIIAHTAANEIKTFADAALKKKIPFINANVPNDGGVNANPYVVILNSTLKTHCEGIYRFVQKYYSLDPIIYFRKRGTQEDQIKNYFEDFGKVTVSVPLNIKYVEIDAFSTVEELAKYFNTTRHTLCITGSLDEVFGKTLAQQLAAIHKTYPLTLMGMPTWDGIKDFNKPEYKGLEIIYSTPFYNPRTDKVSIAVTNHFNTKMFARPTDMVFRGYEATFRFAKLLLLYKKDLSSNLTRKQFNIFRDFDIQPIFLNRQNMTLDYFENKKLYFVKMVDGIVVSVM